MTKPTAAPETKAEVTQDLIERLNKIAALFPSFNGTGIAIKEAATAISTLQAEVERLKDLVYSNDWNVDTGQQKTWQDRYNEAFGLFVHSKRRAETAEAEVREMREAVAKVRDGYASQMKFCDIEALGYFREFVRRIDAALSPKEPSDD